VPSTSFAGDRIHYLDEGQGPAIVFVHAFPLHSEMWRAQVEALSNRYRCLVPDLLGFGRSSAPAELGAYSMTAFAGQIVAALDDAGVTGPVVLCGLSIGGYIAFELLRLHPERIRALVLADTKAEADGPEVIAKRTSQQERVRKGARIAVRDELVTGLLATGTLDDRPDTVARVRSLMENSEAGYTGALEAMKNRPDSTGDLVRIRVPALVIVGEEDRVTPPEIARALHESIGGSQLVVVPGAGHLSNLEAPESFNRALASFLDDLDRGSETANP
jgi:pimeloyl-ACP methyl ester carboxylesterase